MKNDRILTVKYCALQGLMITSVIVSMISVIVMVVLVAVPKVRDVVSVPSTF